MLNGEKEEKTPVFNEFAARVLNFQRRANWMSNVPGAQIGCQIFNFLVRRRTVAGAEMGHALGPREGYSPAHNRA